MPALVRAEELEDLCDGLAEAITCPLAGLSQQRLEFGDSLFYGIEVKPVRLAHIPMTVAA